MVGIGEVLWDILPEGKKLGGAPANFAYHAQALGAQGHVVSAVGDDSAGEEILNELQERELAGEYIQVDRDHPTGSVDVTLDKNGKPDYIIHDNVAWDNLLFTSELNQLAARIHAICFGTLAQRSLRTRETILSFLKATPPDCLRVFDINLRQSYFNSEIVQEALSFSNCLKLNDEELPELAAMCSVFGTENETLQTILAKFKLKMIAPHRHIIHRIIETRAPITLDSNLGPILFASKRAHNGMLRVKDDLAPQPA